ncbi:hypothetical protein [Pseudobacteriovorax antillogorgiicola]|uniref:Uncharacterized protein n=1 Tax=Pseudobacteriovorax antillogorgiicola TaxID=1513793 RepID=A0A1Y6C632_9BACT|nr:hypothetical protein [Pseudobacteriovorax antillogorgiicola]TCS49911.1 hypothetical protein EDD56_114156 [Pseudobacteriovorax antillogorgiicola]SMF44889.1 hypothetical protein SAMN06296036_113161 [Pseudobacteriovorax antillogorgiicola]
MKNLLYVSALSLGLTIGCGSDSDDRTNDSELNFTLEGFESIEAGSQQEINGEIDSDIPLANIKASVKDASGASVYGFKFVSEGFEGADDVRFGLDGDEGVSLRFEVSEHVVDGDYTASIVVTDNNGNQVNKTFKFSVKGGAVQDLEDARKLEAGSDKHATLGSSIDFDESKVCVIGTIATECGGAENIDLVYATGADNDINYIWAPREVADSLGTKWGILSNASNIMFHKVNLTDSEVASVKASSMIESLWDRTKATDTKLAVEEGDSFVVKTSEDQYALIFVDAITANEDGTMSLVFKVKQL